MTDIPQNKDFHERLRHLEAENRKKKNADAPGLVRRFSLTFLRMVAVLPVWLVLLKGVIMAYTGVAAYGARLTELAVESAVPQVVLMLLQPDPFSLLVAQILSGFFAA